MFVHTDLEEHAILHIVNPNTLYFYYTPNNKYTFSKRAAVRWLSFSFYRIYAIMNPYTVNASHYLYYQEVGSHYDASGILRQTDGQY